MQMGKIFRKIKSFNEVGWFLSFRIMLDRFTLHALQRYYGFDRWHANSPLSARPYRRAVADMVNELEPEVVVEVGCGLGVILSMINAKKRIGYDVDLGVVRAARRIRNGNIVFCQGGLGDVREDEIDILILVNWIHEINPMELKLMLTPLLPRARYILLDAVDPDNTYNYKYKHDFVTLLGEGVRCFSEKRIAGEGRSFQLFQVIS